MKRKEKEHFGNKVIAKMNTQQTAVLKRLRGDLRYGDNVSIGIRTGFSREYVGMCLNPKNDRYNPIIVEAALELIKERDAKEKEILEQLNNL